MNALLDALKHWKPFGAVVVGDFMLDQLVYGNADRLSPHERCASTSNRNFEGRQGFKGRTHLVSPAMAAAAAIAGRFVDIRDWK